MNSGREAGDASRRHKRLRQAAIESAVEFHEAGLPVSGLPSYLHGQWQVTAQEVGAERQTWSEFRATGVETFWRLRAAALRAALQADLAAGDRTA